MGDPTIRILYRVSSDVREIIRESVNEVEFIEGSGMLAAKGILMISNRLAIAAILAFSSIPAVAQDSRVIFRATSHSVGVSPAPANCSSPWGSTVLHGSSVLAFLNAAVAYDATCSSEMRGCSNGTLSGSYVQQNCVPAVARTCTAPWGETVSHGASVAAYSAATAADCATVRQARGCVDGTLSGTFVNQSCTVVAPSAVDGVKARCQGWVGTPNASQCNIAELNIDDMGWTWMIQGTKNTADLWCAVLTGKPTNTATSIVNGNGSVSSTFAYVTGYTGNETTLIRNITGYGNVYKYTAGSSNKSRVLCASW